MITINGDTRLVQNKEIITNPVEDTLGMMDVEGGKYYAVDPVGTDIWQLLAEPITLDDMVKKLVEIYDISEEICYNDTKDLLYQLVRSNIAIVVQ